MHKGILEKAYKSLIYQPIVTPTMSLAQNHEPRLDDEFVLDFEPDSDARLQFMES